MNNNLRLGRFLNINSYNSSIDKKSLIKSGFIINTEPIYICKFNFNSNNQKFSIKSWLTKNLYEGSQYIGFFDMEDYKTSLEESRSINTYLTYSSNSITFFYFCLEHIKTNNHKNPNFKHLDIKDLDIIIENKENTVQYFTPPVYNDEIVNEKYKNDGEIDIVANNMYVYGLKMDNANNFFNYEYIYINDNINDQSIIFLSFVSRKIDIIRNTIKKNIPKLLFEDILTFLFLT